MSWVSEFGFCCLLQVTADLIKKKRMSPSHITVQRIFVGFTGLISGHWNLPVMRDWIIGRRERVTHGAQGPISRDGQTFDRSFMNRFSQLVCVCVWGGAAIWRKIICLCRSKFIAWGNLLLVSGSLCHSSVLIRQLSNLSTYCWPHWQLEIIKMSPCYDPSCCVYMRGFRTVNQSQVKTAQYTKTKEESFRDWYTRKEREMIY